MFCLSKNWLKRIISIEENDIHTRTFIRFLGIKISKSKNLKKMYLNTKKNYKKVIERIKSNPDKKIKVVFLVNEVSKWGSQQLYEKFEAHPNFEPLVLVTLLTTIHTGKEHFKSNIDELYNFFKNKNLNVDYAYKDGKYLDLRQFNPDIVFYQQSWQIPKIQFAETVSKFALCCYTSYSIAAAKVASKNTKPFFYTLWRYFLAHDCMKYEDSSWREFNEESLYVSGHPKLDFYKNIETKESDNEKQTVIYAPHHSIEGSILNFATFDWSGQFMLEYAEAHPEINWIFRPHPNLKSYFIRRNYMTEKELDLYYERWGKIGKIDLAGEYFDKFIQSDAMITDCASFLVEYFFTGKPLIHLVSRNSEKHSILNQIVAENYYIVKNKDTFEKYLDEVLIKKNDFLKPVREKNIKEIFKDKNYSSDNIMKHFEETLQNRV